MFGLPRNRHVFAMSSLPSRVLCLDFRQNSFRSRLPVDSRQLERMLVADCYGLMKERRKVTSLDAWLCLSERT